MKVVELIWLGQQIAEVGRQQLQVDAPGIPMAELVVMSDLLDHAPSTITAVTQRTGYAQSRVSSAVARLVERGWAQTQADPTDGRRTVVVVPERIFTAARDRQRTVNERLDEALLGGVADRRRPAVTRALEDLLLALRERTEQAQLPA